MNFLCDFMLFFCCISTIKDNETEVEGNDFCFLIVRLISDGLVLNSYRTRLKWGEKVAVYLSNGGLNDFLVSSQQNVSNVCVSSRSSSFIIYEKHLPWLYETRCDNREKRIYL